jgi:hypothetical protein
LQSARCDAGEFIAGLQNGRREKLSAGVLQLLRLAHDSFYKLRMVVAENATEHARRKIQHLLSVRVPNHAAVRFDQDFIGVRHRHQNVIAVLLPILEVPAVLV